MQARTQPEGQRERGAAPRTSGVQQQLTDLIRSGRMPAFFVLAGGILLLYGFLLSGDFLVGTVVVRGTDIGDPAQVVVTADAIGEPIFTIDASDSAERVAALPYVEQVSVRTRFPDEVVITVVERAPVVLWQTGAQTFLVDEHGNVLAEQPRSGLPQLIHDGDLPVVGGTVDAQQVAAVIAIRETFADQMEELRWDTTDGFVARLTDKRVVILGYPDRMPMKLAVYDEVMRLDAVWATLDLREPERPYYE